MWLVATILIALPSVTPYCKVKFTLTASNPNITFTTPNHPRRHNIREDCTWVVSAPGNVGKLHISCDVNIQKRGFFSCSPLFYFFDYDKPILVDGTRKVNATLRGSTTIFRFKSKMCINVRYKGVSCLVSYKPEDIPTCTTPVDPSCTCGEKGRKRIVFGNETTANEYPWQAIVMNKSSMIPFCGGSVISKQWVLSATHCFIDVSPPSILVVLGEHDLQSISSTRESFEVTDIIMHEHFNLNTTGNNDIALLKLETPVNFSQYISPICLPFNYKYFDFTNKTGVATGWGKINIGLNLIISTVLKQIHQNIIMWSKCTWLDDYEWKQNEITENMICAQAEKGWTSNGDSGGPMVWKSDFSIHYFQLGVISFAKMGYVQTNPDVHTRVSQFVNWIVGKTGGRNDYCIKI